MIKFSQIKKLLIFFLLFLTSCQWEYWDYHNKNALISSQIEQSKTKLDSFDFNKIEQRDLIIWMTPDKSIIDKIISKINSAKNRIYIETYIFTEKRILKSVLEAKKRWIDIQVVLEPNVYWLWNINKKTFDSLNGSNVKVAYADNYNFTHSKFFIIDDEYIISTWNISYSTYTQNREFLVLWNNKKDLEYLVNVFSKDFSKTKYIECNLTIISSPDCSRQPLYEIIKWAKSSVYLYEQSLDDISFQDLLIKKQKSWVKTRIILWDINKAKNNKQVLDRLKSEWIDIISPKKPYVHAKSFLVDDIFFVWSINMTSNSMDNNREIGILFKNDKLISWYKNEFERLFNK